MIEYSKKAWCDGKYLELNEISIPVYSYGLHYGASVYEGIRIYNSKAFKLTQHMERFIFSSDQLQMKIDYIIDQLCEVTNLLIKENDLAYGYIRSIIWRGAGDLLIGSKTKPSVAIFMWGRMSPFIRNIHDKKPQSLTVAKYTRYNEASYPAGAKIGGLYVSNSLSKYIAVEQGYDDAIMLTYDGKVAEATTSNFFVVKNNVIYTPTTKNILNGITRLTVIDLARNLGIEVRELDFDMGFLDDAEEIFLTGTACEIAPVGRVNQREYKVGLITEKIYNAFIKMIEVYDGF